MPTKPCDDFLYGFKGAPCGAPADQPSSARELAGSQCDGQIAGRRVSADVRKAKESGVSADRRAAGLCPLPLR